MANNWKTSMATVNQKWLVLDAAGTPVDNVIKARHVDGGVEIVYTPTDAEGNELIGSINDGATFDSIEASMTIPGGMLEDITED